MHNKLPTHSDAEMDKNRKKLPDLGWEIKLIHPFYSFHWPQLHKKHKNSTLNHKSTQINS